MKMNETLACKLSIMRKLYGKSLVEFAEEIDVSKTTLQNIEAGKANLTLNMVETIANRLGISPMALISDEYDARQLYTAKLLRMSIFVIVYIFYGRRCFLVIYSIAQK